MTPDSFGKILTWIGGVVSALLIAAVLTGAATLREQEQRIIVLETKIDYILEGQTRMLDSMERLEDGLRSNK